MIIRSLKVENLRIVAGLDLALAPRWNFFTGANGAGKTTLLEAAYLLSRGHSFRSASREALVREGSGGYSVFGEIERSDRIVRAGIARTTRRLEARLDGSDVPIGDLLRSIAVVCFEPGSHELIAGASDARRSYLDWGVFHVEHDFLAVWRRYQRALKQRNALLRRMAPEVGLEPWDTELSRVAEPLTVMRRNYIAALQPLVLELLADLLPELGVPTIEFKPGYDDTRPLAVALAERFDSDVARGHTSRGPHRADWSFGFEAARRREYLSRGQEKLCAFAFVLAQARLYAQGAGEWPVICLDDLASEVDAEHEQRILAAIEATGAQVLLTGTDEPTVLKNAAGDVARFHVEQGRVTRLL